MSAILRFSQFVQKTFALWVVVFAFIALCFPAAFVWMKAYIPLGFRDYHAGNGHDHDRG